MEWTTNLLQMPLLCGIIFMIAGLVLYVFPPKKINSIYGYRTSGSMKSIERWHFAQRFSALKMMQGSVFLLLSSFLGLLLKLDGKAALIPGILFPLLVVFFILFTTESALKNKFPNT
ncbi:MULTISPECIES: SdpI family protein [Flavobacterium]|uniref:SdpI family protein n=1 Tax=Flavobacterium TaxID=237 RepID=UPI001FCC4DA9|nr:MULTISPECIES: SdpI family protein [Flavobacterium]UOK43152.1 SdpI family protein [Flavobacterium enshiense]